MRAAEHHEILFAELRRTAGPLAKIEHSGVRYITYPCPSLGERKLNSAIRYDIAELQWNKSGASDRLVGTAMVLLHRDVRGAGRWQLRLEADRRAAGLPDEPVSYFSGTM